jgi:hypothetical protein
VCASSRHSYCLTRLGSGRGRVLTGGVQGSAEHAPRREGS